MIKQNIKMRVTPEQSKAVQEICFKNNIIWNGELANNLNFLERPYLFILKHLETGNSSYDFKSDELEEIDADCFIKKYANNDYQGSEAELLLSKMIDFKDEEYIKLEKKVFNLKKQLEKYVVKIGNQKEEITRLLSQKEELQNRLNTANRTVGMSINIGDDLVKELDEKYTIIKYLESKLYN